MGQNCFGPTQQVRILLVKWKGLLHAPLLLLPAPPKDSDRPKYIYLCYSWRTPLTIAQLPLSIRLANHSPESPTDPKHTSPPIDPWRLGPHRRCHHNVLLITFIDNLSPTASRWEKSAGGKIGVGDKPHGDVNFFGDEGFEGGDIVDGDIVWRRSWVLYIAYDAKGLCVEARLCASSSCCCWVIRLCCFGFYVEALPSPLTPYSFIFATQHFPPILKYDFNILE